MYSVKLLQRLWRQQLGRLAAVDGEIERATNDNNAALEDDEPQQATRWSFTVASPSAVASGLLLLCVGVFLIGGGLDTPPELERSASIPVMAETASHLSSPPAAATDFRVPAPGTCLSGWRAYNITAKDEKEQGTSDPQLRVYEGTALADKCMSIYVRHCLSHALLVGRTGVLYENLSPTWPDTFCLTPRTGQRATLPLHLCFEVRDDWPPVQEYLLNAGCIVYSGPGPYRVELTGGAILEFLLTELAPPAPPSSSSSPPG